jgi:hypothetical protein
VGEIIPEWWATSSGISTRAADRKRLAKSAMSKLIESGS